MNTSRKRFNEDDRRRLLASRGIGPMVVARLESMGYSSLEEIRVSGVDAVVKKACKLMNSNAWTNRRRALESVISEQPSC